MKKIITILSILLTLTVNSQIKYFVQQPGSYTAYGLSSDIKPSSPPNNSFFIEMNTSKTFVASAGQWSLVGIGVDSIAALLAFKTDSLAVALAQRVIDTASALKHYTDSTATALATLTAANLALKQNIGLTGSSTLDFPSTNKGDGSDLTIAVPGVALGRVVVLGVPAGSVIANTNYTAWVSASNQVTIRFNNYSNSNNLNPASGVFSVLVF